MDGILFLFNQLGVAVYFGVEDRWAEGAGSKLRDHIILNPQWLADKIGCLIRDFSLHSIDQDKEAKRLAKQGEWGSNVHGLTLTVTPDPTARRLGAAGERQGVARSAAVPMEGTGGHSRRGGSERGAFSLAPLTRTLTQPQTTSFRKVSFLLTLLQNFGLLCKLPTPDDEEGVLTQWYLVPAVLPPTLPVGQHEPAPTDLRFGLAFKGFLPPDFFERLIALAVGYSQRIDGTPPVLSRQHCVLNFGHREMGSFTLVYAVDQHRISMYLPRSHTPGAINPVAPRILRKMRSLADETNEKYYRGELKFETLLKALTLTLTLLLLSNTKTSSNPNPTLTQTYPIHGSRIVIKLF